MSEGTDSRCTTAPSKPGDPLQSWRCEPLSLPTFFAAAKKVGAAPHRGNANRPLTNQAKPNNSRTNRTPTPAEQANPTSKSIHQPHLPPNGDIPHRPHGPRLSAAGKRTPTTTPT